METGYRETMRGNFRVRGGDLSNSVSLRKLSVSSAKDVLIQSTFVTQLLHIARFQRLKLVLSHSQDGTKSLRNLQSGMDTSSCSTALHLVHTSCPFTTPRLLL